MICKKCNSQMVCDRVLMSNPPYYVLVCPECGESVTVTEEQFLLDLNKIVVNCIYDTDLPLPTYETIGSAGCDLRANITEDITIGTLERTCVPTGLFIELPVGYEVQIRPRSGLALKKGITVLNTPGTINY